MAQLEAPRLLVISSYFHPDRGGGSAVNTDLCQGLAERGFEVTVWTASSHYPEWRDKTGDNGWRIRDETLDDVRVRRFGLFIPRDATRLWQRLLYEASFFLSLLRSLAQARRYDAIMVFCPLVASVGIGALAALLFRKPLWLNVQDLAAEAAQAGGILKSGTVSALFRGVQRWLFNRANVWSSISPVMVQRLEQLRRAGQPILELPNWLNRSLAQVIAALGPKIGRSPAQPVRLLYAGNFGRKQNFIALLDAFRNSNAAFHLQMHGDGAEMERLREWFARHAADPRFALGPFLDETGFARALHACDLFVLPEIDGSGASFLPSKLTAVMACGTPVLGICDADSPLGHELRQSQCGPLLGWSDLADLERILTGIVGDAETFRRWQERALMRGAFFDRENILARFDAQLRSLVASPR